MTPLRLARLARLARIASRPLLVLAAVGGCASTPDVDATATTEEALVRPGPILPTCGLACGVGNPGRERTVPLVLAPPAFIAGHGCDANDPASYGRAASVELGGGAVAYIERAATDLWMCLGGLPAPATQYVVHAQLDLDHTQTSTLGARDVQIDVAPLANGSIELSSGSGPGFTGPGLDSNQYFVQQDPNVVVDGQKQWHVQLHVALSAIGGAWHDLGARFSFAKSASSTSWNPQVQAWPTSTDPNAYRNPSTWGTLRAGAAAPPAIHDFTPFAGSTPRMLQPGTTVVVRGADFDDSTDVYFGNDFEGEANGKVVSAKAPRLSVSPTQIVVSVPRYATTGQIEVVRRSDGQKARSAGPFVVDDVRDRWSFPFGNFKPGASWDEYVDAFGYGQTHWGLLPSLPALVAWGISVGLEGSHSACFGIARTALQVDFHDVDEAPYDRPYDANDPWTPVGVPQHFVRPGADGQPQEPLRSHIDAMHLSQFSAEWLHAWAATGVSNYADHAFNLNKMKAAFASGELTYLAVRYGAFKGHVVLAYDVEPVEGGELGYKIYVVDPNQPFDQTIEWPEAQHAQPPSAGFAAWDPSAPDTTKPAYVHAGRLNDSIVWVDPFGNWSFKGGFGGGPWSGDASSIMAVRYTELPRGYPTLPDSLEGIATLVFGDAAPSQVSDGAGRTLYGARGALNANATGRLPDAVPWAPLGGDAATGVTGFVALGAGRDYDVALTGSAAGTYRHAAMGGGTTVTLANVPTAIGEVDTLHVSPTNGAFAFTAPRAKTFDVQLARKASDGSPMEIDAKGLAAAAGAKEALGVDATGLVTIMHGGPSGAIALTLTGGGKARTLSLPVATGDAITLRPAGWNVIDVATIASHVAHADGTTTDATYAPPPPPATVAAIYRFREQSGQTASNTLGGTDTLTLGSSPSADANDPTWDHDDFSLSFSGSQYLLADGTKDLEPGRVTVETWAKASGSPGLYRYLVAKGASACTSASYALSTGGNGGIGFYITQPNGMIAWSPMVGPEIWDGHWHHFAGVYDGAKVALYVDGLRVQDGTAAPGPIVYDMPVRALAIGDYHGTCDLPFQGSIGWVLVWNGPLAASDVLSDAMGYLSTTPIGSGTITASVGDIRCPTRACEVRVRNGTIVTLTATPSTGSAFKGWAGACSGSGGSPTCTVPIDRATYVTANFGPP